MDHFWTDRESEQTVVVDGSSSRLSGSDIFTSTGDLRVDNDSRGGVEETSCQLVQDEAQVIDLQPQITVNNKISRALSSPPEKRARAPRTTDKIHNYHDDEFENDNHELEQRKVLLSNQHRFIDDEGEDDGDDDWLVERTERICNTENEDLSAGLKGCLSPSLSTKLNNELLRNLKSEEESVQSGHLVDLSKKSQLSNFKVPKMVLDKLASISRLAGRKRAKVMAEDGLVGTGSSGARKKPKRESLEHELKRIEMHERLLLEGRQEMLSFKGGSCKVVERATFTGK